MRPVAAPVAQEHPIPRARVYPVGQHPGGHFSFLFALLCAALMLCWTHSHTAGRGILSFVASYRSSGRVDKTQVRPDILHCQCLKEKKKEFFFIFSKNEPFFSSFCPALKRFIDDSRQGGGIKGEEHLID